MKTKLLHLLQSLHGFNKLDDRIVGIISESFNVDAEKICREHGITYGQRT